MRTASLNFQYIILFKSIRGMSIIHTWQLRCSKNIKFLVDACEDAKKVPYGSLLIDLERIHPTRCAVADPFAPLSKNRSMWLHCFGKIRGAFWGNGIRAQLDEEDLCCPHRETSLNFESIKGRV